MKTNPAGVFQSKSLKYKLISLFSGLVELQWRDCETNKEFAVKRR